MTAVAITAHAQSTQTIAVLPHKDYAASRSFDDTTRIQQTVGDAWAKNAFANPLEVILRLI